MNKKMINKFFILLAVGLFFASPVLATNSGLSVEFEKEPLFRDVNFLPGQTITRWVKVTNNSGQTQRIAVEAINISNSDKLGDVLVLTIKEGDGERYKNDLSRFFEAGEVYLFTDLANGQTIVYDFSVSFWPEAKNSFQGKSLGFDILVGFQGEGGGLPSGSGGGIGGYLPPGLTITEPVFSIVGITTATIKWETSYEATSRVVYGTDPYQFDLSVGEPSYGYKLYSDKNTIKTKNHSITLTGLDSNTIYYYRCVSHGSLAITKEHSFTTLSLDQGNGENGNSLDTPVGSDDVFITPPDYRGPVGQWSGTSSPSQGEERAEDLLIQDDALQISQWEESDQNNNKGIFNSLFAAIGTQSICLLLIIAIAILIILFFLSVKKGKIEQKRIYWILPFLAIGLFILYFFFCPYWKIVGVIMFIISLIVYVAMMLKA